VGAIQPGAHVLDTVPMDTPLYALDGVGDPLVISGSGIFVDLQAYNLATTVVDTLRFGTDGYNDPSGPGYYTPVMTQSLNFRRDIFSGNTTGGANRVSFGELRLANTDGGLDSLRTGWAFAGWPATLRIGDANRLYTTFEVLITGKPQQVFFSYGDVAITLRDRLQDFAQPVQTTKYLGTNVLPNGLEGLLDLKDKPKPLLFGLVQNISPPLVNTAKLIFQINDGAIEDVSAVYDKGVALTPGLDYADQADMFANQPAAGSFRCWKAGGYFRLGASPVGTITCDATDRFAWQDNTAARVGLRISSRPPGSGEGGITDADVAWGDVTILDQKNSSTVGIWIADETQFLQAMDLIFSSIGAWYGFDRFGKFRMQRHELPRGTGVCSFKQFGPGVDATIFDFDISDVRFLPTNDPDRGVPTWQVSLDYSANYTVQQADALGGAVDDIRRNFLALQYRTATATNTAIKTPYPLAMTKKITTALIDPNAASTEANRLLAMYQSQRDFVEIDTPLRSELIATVDIGADVFVVLPRFQYTAGKAMKVIGMQYNPSGRGLTLMLWG
jgi:hypothetical protein